MDRAFKIIGALSVSISAGVLLGMSTPTVMKASPEADWRFAARGAHAGKPIALTQPTVVYASMPEDLSPQVGYGSPDAYQSQYVDAPVRNGYTAVPGDAAKPVDAHPARTSAAASAPDARDAQARAAASSKPANFASSKTVDMPSAVIVQEPAFDNSVEAPAVDVSGQH